MELYWGYKVRYASNLGGVFSDSPYKEGYDYIIGTSEHGKIISSSELILPSFRYIVFTSLGLPSEFNSVFSIVVWSAECKILFLDAMT
jgi:predicted SPOUT superfamily RNA methylase MTH1